MDPTKELDGDPPKSRKKIDNYFKPVRCGVVCHTATDNHNNYGDLQNRGPMVPGTEPTSRRD